MPDFRPFDMLNFSQAVTPGIQNLSQMQIGAQGQENIFAAQQQLAEMERQRQAQQLQQQAGMATDIFGTQVAGQAMQAGLNPASVLQYQNQQNQQPVGGYGRF